MPSSIAGVTLAGAGVLLTSVDWAVEAAVAAAAVPKARAVTVSVAATSAAQAVRPDVRWRIEFPR